jgi:hypothetical protein
LPRLVPQERLSLLTFFQSSLRDSGIAQVSIPGVETPGYYQKSLLDLPPGTLNS